MESMISQIKNYIKISITKADFMKSFVFSGEIKDDSFDITATDGSRYNIKISKVYTEKDRKEVTDVFCGKK